MRKRNIKFKITKIKEYNLVKMVKTMIEN